MEKDPLVLDQIRLVAPTPDWAHARSSAQDAAEALDVRPQHPTNQGALYADIVVDV